MGENMELASVQPFVTIIMPVRNEAKYIGAALESELNQVYAPYMLEI